MHDDAGMVLCYYGRDFPGDMPRPACARSNNLRGSPHRNPSRPCTPTCFPNAVTRSAAAPPPTKAARLTSNMCMPTKILAVDNSQHKAVQISCTIYAPQQSVPQTTSEEISSTVSSPVQQLASTGGTIFWNPLFQEDSALYDMEPGTPASPAMSSAAYRQDANVQTILHPYTAAASLVTVFT